MLEQLLGELIGMFDWVTAQLGWEGSLGWFQILLLVLAVVGTLVIARNLIGGSSRGGGGGGSSVVYPPQGVSRGFPTSFYVGDKKLGSFGVKKEVYDFRVPTPTPNLSMLREPVKLDIEKASKLFLMPQCPRGVDRGLNEPNQRTEPTVSRKLATLGPDSAGAQLGQQAERISSQEKENVVGELSSRPAGPDWSLARKLFVGKKPRLW